MTQTEMLHQMCHDNLSNADVKAISQCRGFSAAEAASRALFESFFLSEIGVAAALRTLTRTEVVLLHLLHSRATPVDIAFFSRVYPDSGVRYGSYTQRYQSVLQAVRTGLIRRGLLMMAESGNDADGDSKMARWRFHFPQQFAHLLPPLLEGAVTLETPGPVKQATVNQATVNQDKVRQKVLSLLNNERFALPAANDPNYQLTITRGGLRMGEGTFRVATLQTWQQACWAVAAPRAQAEQPLSVAKKTPELSPAAAATYAFAQLAPNAWLTPDQLTPLLQVFCDDPKPQAEKLCVAGWEWGCLARQSVDNTHYYRLPAQQDAATTQQPGVGLTITGDQIKVDLATIDFADLEILVQIANWHIANGQAIAAPSLIKLGNLPANVRSHPLLQWLQSNAPAFAQAVRTVARRWGKQIVHDNLLLAKINDLSLKITIQKALAGDEQLLVLPNDFIAFPRGLLPAIDKLVKQSGYAIKQITPPKTT